MSNIRFELNRQAAKQLENDAGMKRAVQSIAEDIADEMENRAPDMVKQNATFSADTQKGSSGWEGLAIVKSPFWHWAEYSTGGRHFRTPQPFIRPAGQSVMSRHGGRWKPQ